MLDFGLTAVFGGGDDASGAGTSPRTTDFPDVTVFGGDPDCKAVRLLPPRRIAEEFGPANVNLNRFWMDWALTPHRLAAFVNAPTRGTAEKQTNPEKSGLLKMTKSWTEKAPETFGPQQPGEPMRIADLRCFLEVSRNEIAGIDLGSRTLGPGFEPSHPQCFRITLDDGSGFDFYKPQPDLDHMMDMTQGRS